MAEPQNKDDSDESVFDNLTGTQKSAILMMLIGEDEASEILAQPVATRGAASWHRYVFGAGP